MGLDMQRAAVSFSRTSSANHTKLSMYAHSFFGNLIGTLPQYGSLC